MFPEIRINIVGLDTHFRICSALRFSIQGPKLHCGGCGFHRGGVEWLSSSRAHVTSADVHLDCIYADHYSRMIL